MRLKQIAIVILFFAVLTSCRKGYKVENGKVYYEYWNEGTGQNKMYLKHADAKTFRELDLDCDGNFVFGKDKDHLYIDGELIKNIDPHTFKFMGNYIFRDKDSAYFFGFYNDLNNCAIKGVNPNKLKLIQYPWAKTNNLIIHGGEAIELNHVNDFVPIDEDWGKTKEHIVYNNHILYGADVKSFKITSSFEGKDKRFRFEFGAIVEEEFRKARLNNFDFSRTEYCHIEPIVFVDINKNLVSYEEDEKNPIITVEKLKEQGFSVANIKPLEWGDSQRMIRVTLNKGHCVCVVEKCYNRDFSLPSETKKAFNVTERMYNEAIGH